MIRQIKAKWGPHEHRPEIMEFPDTCPICNRGIDAEIVFAILTGILGPDHLQIVYRCPRGECAELFIGTYQKGTIHQDPYFLKPYEPSRSTPVSFATEVEEVSP